MLVGPTAAGKTEVSLEIAGDIFEIVSSDSVQVYRYLDIGSGKPTEVERKRVPHHLVDIVNPDVKFSAGDYCIHAERAAAGIVKRGRVPFFVGGTGLYIDSFFKGISDIPSIEKSVKEGLQQELALRGLDELYKELLQYDRPFAERIHHNDRQRILRGLEVIRATGKPLSDYFVKRTGHESADTLYIGMAVEKNELYERIDRRVDAMIGKGLVDEVAGLRDMGYSPGLNSMKSIGYSQVNEYLDGLIPLDEAVMKIKSETRKYAKRQMTWFRKNHSIHWVGLFEVEKIKMLIHNWFDA